MAKTLVIDGKGVRVIEAAAANKDGTPCGRSWGFPTLDAFEKCASEHEPQLDAAGAAELAKARNA